MANRLNSPVENFRRQLLDYINQSRQAGVSDSQIRQALLDAGWQENDINQHLGFGVNNPAGQNLPPPQYALPSAFSLFKQALSLYGSHFRLIFGITIIPLVINILGIFLGKTISLTSILFGILYVILSSIIGFISYLALFGAVTDIDNSTVGSAYKKGLSMFFPFIWISFLIFLPVLGGFVLLIIPGILISLWLSQSVFVLYAEGNRGMSALAKSWHYVKGRAGSVFWRFLFYVLAMLLILFVFGLLIGGSTLSISGLKTLGQPSTQQVSIVSQILNTVLNNLVMIPFGIVYSYLLFSSLKATKTELLDEEKERKLKKKITIFMVIGILGIVAITFLLVLVGISLIKLLFSSPYPTSLIHSSSLFSSIGLPFWGYFPFGR